MLERAALTDAERAWAAQLLAGCGEEKGEASGGGTAPDNADDMAAAPDLEPAAAPDLEPGG